MIPWSDIAKESKENGQRSIDVFYKVYLCSIEKMVERSSSHSIVVGTGCGDALPWHPSALYVVVLALPSYPEATVQTVTIVVRLDRYEFDPQQIWKKLPDIAKPGLQINDFREEIDGMVIAWPGELEPESEQVWLKNMSRKGAVYLPVSDIWGRIDMVNLITVFLA